MEVVMFRITGKIKEINRKKVLPREKFSPASCFLGFPPPYEVGTDYSEIILEEYQISPNFEDELQNGNIRLVFFDKKFSEKEFIVSQKYFFSCTGSWMDGSEVY